MKKTLLTSLFTLISSAAFAQIAIVDTQYVFENADMTKSSKEEIIEITKSEKAKLKAKEEVLAKKQEELIAKKSVMNKDTFAQKQEELKKDIISFKKSVKISGEKLRNLNNEKKQQIAEKISQAVEKISKEKKYEMVIAKTFVMYNTDAVEITSQVLEEVNKK
jgi:Skp family chaperone for outer membrane proteins|tara:strand:+ start:1035 stop:1523 length:489 start_codon:yes stop_codon:yes gene_type:complete